MSRVVVVGSGAREHALAWGLAKSAEVVVTPGNDGMVAHGLTCTPRPATELEADLFVIGPELPLVDGLADQLRAQGKLVLGPNADGARLEGSKAFMKDFLADADVPTADYEVFSDEAAAHRFLAESMTPPYVIKTDGLAAGKGVLVTNSLAEARLDVSAKVSGDAFASAGSTIVIEEGLDGEECSLIVLCDGRSLFALSAAQDFKRVGDGGTGPNTGGMGAYAPMPIDPDLVDGIMETMLRPTLKELLRREIDYRGVLYAGVMLTSAGPQLLEYNVRFGDPETEVLVPLYGDQLFALLQASARGTLGEVAVSASGAAVTVVMAAHGYPDTPRRGDRIAGLGDDGQLAHAIDGVVVFHAGSARVDGHFVTNGGRVLAVTAHADDLATARSKAYEAVGRISFDGCVVRSDIALDAVKGIA